MVVFGVSHGMLGESCTMMSESDQTKTSKRIREVPAGHQGSGCVGCPRAPRALALGARHDNIITYNDSSVRKMIHRLHKIRKLRKQTCRLLRTFGPQAVTHILHSVGVSLCYTVRPNSLRKLRSRIQVTHYTCNV